MKIVCALGKGAPKELLPTAMPSFPQSETRSWSALGQTAQRWLAPALSRNTACRGFPDISNPLLGTKPLPGSLLQEQPCAFPSTPALEENLCPFHREPVSLSGDQAQADAMAPGARFREADPWVDACWRSSQVLPVALQLAEDTLWGEHEAAPVVMTVLTGGAHFWSSPNIMDQSRSQASSQLPERPQRDVRAGQPWGQAECLSWSLMQIPPLCIFSCITFNLKTIPKHAHRYLCVHLSVSDALKRQIQFLRKPRVWNKNNPAFVGSYQPVKQRQLSSQIPRTHACNQNQRCKQL